MKHNLRHVSDIKQPFVWLIDIAFTVLFLFWYNFEVDG